MKKLKLVITLVILYCSASAQLILEFNTSLSSGTTITLPLNGTVNATVDWGDGSTDSYTTLGDKAHTYADNGIFTVSISGTLTQFGKWDIGYNNADKLTRVISFGNIGLTSLNGAFYQASNLTQVPSQLPNTVTDISRMFAGASSFNQDIGDWDVSNVTEMTALFDSATSFNQDIGSWELSKISDLRNLFRHATAFNQDLKLWDVSKVVNMDSMFAYATSFNADISLWNVFKVESMNAMFKGATLFNSDITGWNVFKVTDMTSMFEDAIAFNQDIGSWDVKKVTNMNRMFYNTTSFDQDIGGWNITKVTSMVDMFYGVKLSTAFYNNLLMGWVSQNVKNNVIFHGGNSQYTAGDASDAREVLISTNLWTITDGGLYNGIVITTTEPTDITLNAATSGGIITYDGGSSITQRGVVWSTLNSPTADSHLGITSDGSDIGSYTSSINGLNAGSTYFIRSYAINSTDTAYGNTVSLVTKQELTITGTFTVNNKEYDGNLNSVINSSNLALSGILIGHSNVSLSNIVAVFSDSNAGDNKTVSILNAELTGTDAYKYVLSLNDAPTYLANITQKPLTVNNAIALDKTYDGTTVATILNGALKGVISGDEVFINSNLGQFSNKNVGLNKEVLTELTISGSSATNYSLIQPSGISADITPAPLGITGAIVMDKIYDGNTTAVISNAIFEGLIPGDIVDFENLNGFFNDKNVGSNKPVNANIIIVGTDSENYSLAQPTNLLASITPKELSIENTVAENKIYDRTYNAILNNSILMGLISGDNVSILSESGYFNSRNAGANIPITTNITISGSDIANYNLIQPTGLSADILPQELTVTNLNIATKIYDGTTTAAITNGTLEGVIDGDGIIILSRTGFYIDKNVGTNKPIEATINITGANISNYNVVQPEGLVGDIIAKNLTVNGTLVSSKIYDGTQNAAISNSKLIGVASGDNIFIETETGTFSDKYVGANKPVTTNITVTGSDINNYNLIQPTWLKGRINSKPLYVLNAVAEDKVYDGTTNAAISGATLDGVIDSDDVKIGSVTGSFNSKNVGVNKTITTNITIYGNDASNYTLNQPGNLKADISPAQLTTTNTIVENKVYDGSVVANLKGTVIQGILPSDIVNINQQTGNFNSKHAGKNKPVSATITINGGDANNYILEQPAGLTADISERTVNITGSFFVANKIYDGTPTATITENNLKLQNTLSNDAVYLANLVAEFFEAEVGKDILVELVNIELGGTDRENYILSLNDLPTTTASITAPVEVADSESNKLEAYPNPFSNYINISSTENVHKIFIANITGKIITEQVLSNQQAIKTQELPTGIYFLTILFDNNSTTTLKIIKE